MNTHTENAPNTPDSTVLSDHELGKINAAGVGASSYIAAYFSSLMSLVVKPRVNPVNPALHPDDPGDGSAWNNLPNRGGHYDG
ncbi:MAG: hypothetical protein OXU62_07855 [Gammaproteobacteria bacterium]|nr:hypothetical protein [Gammaproteobacteria bacterium]